VKRKRVRHLSLYGDGETIMIRPPTKDHIRIASVNRLDPTILRSDREVLWTSSDARVILANRGTNLFEPMQSLALRTVS